MPSSAERAGLIRWVWAVVLLVAVVGCTVGPDYHRPEPSAGPPPARFAAATASVSVADPPDAWWRLYDDPALAALVVRALVANTDLRVALANLDATRAALDLASAARTPATVVTAGATYGVSSTELIAARFGRREPRSNWTLAPGLAASWELDLFGRIRRGIEAAGADVAAAAAAADGVRVTVAAETARAYADACSYGAAAAVQRRSIELAQHGVTITLAQRSAGSVGDYEVMRSAALLDQTRSGLPQLEAQRANALFRLAVLTGAPPEAVPQEAAACMVAPRLVGAIPIGDGRGLLARRPDVRQAERRLAGDTARIGVATASLYPTISLGASVASVAPNFAGLGAAAGRSFALGPLLSWSFPNISVTRARIRGANAQAAASLATFDGTVLAALRDVEQALTTEAAERARREDLFGARMRDAAAVRIAEDRYRAGSITFLELFDVQRTLIADDSAVALSDQALATDQVLLFKALGGGWKNVGR